MTLQHNGISPVATAALLSLAGCSAPHVDRTSASPAPEAPSTAEVGSDNPLHAATLAPVRSYAALALFGSWAPWSTPHARELPASITKVPEHSADAVFGEFPFGDLALPPEKRMVGFMVDEVRQYLVIDENRDGDLTNDLNCVWQEDRHVSPTGAWGIVTARAEVASSDRLGAPTFGVALFFTERETRRREGSELEIDRYRDYGTQGVVALGGESYRIALDDQTVSGDFSHSLQSPREDIIVRIDVNQSGSFEEREGCSASAAFSINGKGYRMESISSDGTRIVIAEIPEGIHEALSPPRVLEFGDRVPSFEAVTQRGEHLRFPDDFKGKIVLLDFWAGWCGPCIRELPYIAKAYEEFRDQGFEVVSISLDTEDTQPRALEHLEKVGASWHQVFTGKRWEGDIVRQYGPQGIPAGYLVHGDSGRLIGSLHQIRMERLRPMVRRALDQQGSLFAGDDTRR